MRRQTESFLPSRGSDGSELLASLLAKPMHERKVKYLAMEENFGYYEEGETERKIEPQLPPCRFCGKFH